MTVALTDQTLGNLACSIPGATRVFHQYRLDFCCGGNVPLHEAAASRGLDAAQIAAELTALGHSLRGPVCALSQWALDNIAAIHEAQAAFDTGAEVDRAA